MAESVDNSDGLDTLTETLNADNAFFKGLLDLVPVQFYFDNAAKQKLKSRQEESDDNEESTVQAVKRKGGLSQKAQAKRAKFDPQRVQTVTQLTEQLLAQDKADNTVKIKKPKKPKVKLSGEDRNVLKTRTESLEDLRERLSNTIQKLKEKRKSLTKEEWIEKRKLKQQEKKMKRKLRKEHAKQNTHPKGERTMNGKAPKGAGQNKPIFNKEGQMVFSKFDFSESGETKKTDALTGKNYKKLLETVKKRKEKLEKLKEKDKEAAESAKQKLEWKTALQKAEGIKVKDNVELLQKSMKRKDKLKKRSQKKWKEREGKVEERKKERQEKRTKNIQKKKQGKIQKKIQKSKKKGRIVPGF